MNHLRYFAGRRDRQVECAIVGTGGFGRSFLAQARHVPGLSCRVAVDRDSAVAAAGLAGTGIPPSGSRAARMPPPSAGPGTGAMCWHWGIWRWQPICR